MLKGIRLSKLQVIISDVHIDSIEATKVLPNR